MSSETPSQDRNESDNGRHDDYRIALYYCYIGINNVAAHVEFQTSLCKRLDLCGRIRVATEGINGVLSGTKPALEDYEASLCEQLDLSRKALDLKYCLLRPDLAVKDQLFTSLSVQATSCVVSLVEQRQSPKKKNQLKSNGDEDSYETVKEIWSQTLQALQEETLQTSNENQNERHQPSDATCLNPPRHLSPNEWNEQLQSLQQTPTANVLLVDCRNFYESNIGYFAVDGPTTVKKESIESPSDAEIAHSSCPSSTTNIHTMLTNTRKFSDLPQVFVEQQNVLQDASHIFMYCTGGVRCERASRFLQQLLVQHETAKNQTDTNEALKIPEIYQLHGGIQRYLQEETKGPCYFRGKNFVFDPRRTDPVTAHNTTTDSKESAESSMAIVGKCLVCNSPHDDYDNGHAPVQGREARCWTCRTLILVCNTCRVTVSCWGESESDKPRIYCGGQDGNCLHRPAVVTLSVETN